MEADESVPLTFEKQENEEGGLPEVIPGMQVRGTVTPAEVIDITGLIADLESSRKAGRR